MGRTLSEVSRREERIFVSFPVQVRPPSQKGAVSGSTVNYSPRGLRVHAGFAFQPGQELEIFVGDVERRPQPYRVVWVRKPNGGDSVYEAGLEVQR